MPRKTPPPHPAEAFIDEHYPRRVGTSTRKKYAAIWRRMEQSREEPGAWLKDQVKHLDGTDEKAAKTTIGVLRSAVLYYLRWKHYERTKTLLGEEDVQLLGSKLPTAAEGERGETRRALTAEQLERYRDVVREMPVSKQIITVLLLLPHTGLRIFEACGLRVENVIRRGSEWSLDIIGKGKKQRFVPVNDSAKELLEPYLREKPPGLFLFENPYLDSVPWSTRPDLSPAQVRAVVRERLQGLEELSDVVPHILRHQFASDATNKNVNVLMLKELMGHSSTATLERYAHPNADALRGAVNLLNEKPRPKSL